MQDALAANAIRVDDVVHIVGAQWHEPPPAAQFLTFSVSARRRGKLGDPSHEPVDEAIGKLNSPGTFQVTRDLVNIGLRVW